MSAALPLPPRPKLASYEQLARDLHQAATSRAPGGVAACVANWMETLAGLLGRRLRPENRATIAHESRRAERWWSDSRRAQPAPATLAEAQDFVARRMHGFPGWAPFTEHLQALQDEGSMVSHFESAAEAIAGGDLPQLRELLARQPSLVCERSAREHRSTLLHYVSANGVEDFRQRTPANIVAITELLLAAGADVHAQSDAYGGRSTTLGLTATSCHPEHAGVQRALLELLVAHGAAVDGPDGGSGVNSCLANGRGAAAEFLAGHGARLDLEGAAGVGRLDVVEYLIRSAGRLARPESGGPTGLHWAAYGGHADVVRLLLQHRAAVDTKEKHCGGTPLGWALYGWGPIEGRVEPRGAHIEVVRLLAQAGATLDEPWYAEDAERRGALERAREDPAMRAALRGEPAPGTG